MNKILKCTLEAKVQVHCPNLLALFTNFRCVVLFIILNKVVLPFESVDEILTCDHSNESYGPFCLSLLHKMNSKKQIEFLFWAFLSLKKYRMLMMIVVTTTINVI